MLKTVIAINETRILRNVLKSGMFMRTSRQVYFSPFDFWILQLRWALSEQGARGCNLLTIGTFHVSTRFMYRAKSLQI